MTRLAPARQPLGGSLATSTELSKYYYPMSVAPIDIIRVLNRAKVRFTLVGAHALGAWTHRPRTTHDVAVVVAARHVKKAVAALVETFPYLVPRDLPVSSASATAKQGRSS
jgi:hypothetical protein